MRNINEISFEEFAETVDILEDIAIENKSLFAEMLMDICKECRLAGEMLFFIIEMHNKGKLKSPELVTEHHKVILAMWLLLNDYQRSDTTLH